MSFIFIGESIKKNRNQIVNNQCKHISGNQPLKKEDDIDYDIETEEELEEEEAEDINNLDDDKEEDEEFEEEEC